MVVLACSCVSAVTFFLLEPLLLQEVGLMVTMLVVDKVIRVTCVLQSSCIQTCPFSHTFMDRFMLSILMYMDTSTNMFMFMNISVNMFIFMNVSMNTSVDTSQRACVGVR